MSPWRVDAASILSRGCYRGTDTYGDVDTRLVIFQTDANGSESACGAATYYPTPGTGNGFEGNYLRTRVRDDIHHLKVYMPAKHRLVLSSSCAPKLNIRVRVRAVAGDPIKIDGSRTAGGVLYSLSNGIARGITDGP